MKYTLGWSFLLSLFLVMQAASPPAWVEMLRLKHRHTSGIVTVSIIIVCTEYVPVCTWYILCYCTVPTCTVLSDFECFAPSTYWYVLFPPSTYLVNTFSKLCSSNMYLVCTKYILQNKSTYLRLKVLTFMDLIEVGVSVTGSWKNNPLRMSQGGACPASSAKW